MLPSPCDRKGNWFKRHQTFRRQKQNTRTGRSWGISKNFMCKSSTWPPRSLQVEKAGEKSPAVKGRATKVMLPLPSSRENTMIRILGPDAHSHAWSPLFLPFLLSGILASLKASTVPEPPKPIQVKPCPRNISPLCTGHAVPPLFSGYLVYGPNLLSVGLM